MPLDYRARSRGDDVHFDRKGKAALQRRRDDEATVFGLSGRYLLPYLSIRRDTTLIYGATMNLIYGATMMPQCTECDHVLSRCGSRQAVRGSRTEPVHTGYGVQLHYNCTVFRNFDVSLPSEECPAVCGGLGSRLGRGQHW